MVRDRLTAFKASTAAITIPASTVSVSDLVNNYFKARPPFEDNGTKKNEFPDAIALFSLDRWAKLTGQKILAVSMDKGWKAFAEHTDWIDVVDDLTTALATLQTHSTTADQAINALLYDMEMNTHTDLTQQLTTQLSRAVADMEVIGEGESSLTFDLDDYNLDLTSAFPIGSADDYDFTIVRMSEHELVAQVCLNAHLRAHAEFSLSIKDGIDKDYITVGAATNDTEVETELQALITLTGDWTGPLDELEVDEVELIDRSININFGSIEVDYSEDPAYEKWLEAGGEEDI